MKPASYQHCSDGGKGNLWRQQKSNHIARISLFGWCRKNDSCLLIENNMKILSCTKSTLFSLAHLEVTTTQGRSVTQELAMKLARTAHVLWQREPGALTGVAASFLVCSHQAQAATWAPDVASSCKSGGLIWLHPCWSKQNGPHSAPAGYSGTVQH